MSFTSDFFNGLDRRNKGIQTTPTKSQNTGNYGIAPVIKTTPGASVDLAPMRSTVGTLSTNKTTKNKKFTTVSADDDKYSKLTLTEIELELARLEKEKAAHEEKYGGKVVFAGFSVAEKILNGLASVAGTEFSAPISASLDEAAKKYYDYQNQIEKLQGYKTQKAIEEKYNVLDEETKTQIKTVAGGVGWGHIKGVLEFADSDNVFETESQKSARKALEQKGYSDEDISELVDLYERQRDSEMNREVEKEMADFGSEHPGGQIAQSAVTDVFGGMLGNLSVAKQYADKVQGTGSNYGINTDTFYHSITKGNVAADAQAKADHNWKIKTPTGKEVDAFDAVFDIGSGIADNVARIALGGGSSTASGVMMGSQVFNQSVIEGKEKGYSDEKALTIGLLQATVESLTEKYSVETILGDSGGIARRLTKSFIAEGSEGVASDWLNMGLDVIANGEHSEVMSTYNDYIKQGYSEDAALAHMIYKIGGDTLKTFLMEGTTGLALGGGVTLVNTAQQNTSTQSEKNTINKIVDERVSEKARNQAIENAVNKAIEERETAQGGKFTDENKQAFSESYKAKIESGEVELSDETLSKEEIAKIKKEVKDELKNGKIDLSKLEELLTPEETKQINELTESLEGIKDEQKKAEIQGKIKQLEGAKAEILKTQAKENKFLAKAVFEKVASTKNYEYDGDLSKITDEYEKAAIESAIRHLNNTTEAKRYGGIIAKLAKDRQTRYILTNNQELMEQGDLVSREGITAEDRAKIKALEEQLAKAESKKDKKSIQAQIIALKYADVGGLVRKNVNGVETVLINVDSKQAMYTVAGHETKHVLEKYDLNKKFNEILFDYAKAKGDLDAVRDRITDTYKSRKDVDIEGEVAAELTGKYLFEDEKFLDALMKQKSDSKVQEVINKIKELIDDLVIRFKGTEQEKQLREVQKKFTELYNSSDADVVKNTAEKNTTDEGGVKYSLIGKNKDGIEVYETSQDTMDLTWVERKAKYLDIMQDEYSDKTARFKRNGHTYRAKFDQSSLRKHIYGDKRSSRDGVRALIKAGADGDVFDLVENSQYDFSKPNKKNNTNADYFDYFVKTVQIDGKVFDLVADVEKDYGVKDGYVYTLALRDNKTIKASPANETSQSEPLQNAGNAFSDDILPQNPKKSSENNQTLTDIDGNLIDTARISKNESDNRYSLSHNPEIAKGQSDYLANHKSPITVSELADAQEITNAMVDVMMKYSSILPEDKIGKVLTKNGSYDRSVENTTICVRTLAYNEFVDKVQEEIGRPLTQMESFLVSQKMYDIATDPQCLYCYVSLDRKAFNDMLLRYMQERDTVIDKYRNSDKSPDSIKKLYEDFLNGRKDTKNMSKRFNDWLSYVDNGTQLLSLADIATEARQKDIANGKDSVLAAQLKDARAYAQSASWSKIQKDYVAYRDEILKLGDRVVKNLNEHYGMRWYSFSDYSAAFIVENMQQITDASIRGLKGLSYTKDTDYAEIFAPSGMNINISVFVNADENGDFFIDERQSANFEKALELRAKYPNVGIVATVTNDEALRWAGEQEWSDVIIPFHIVRTGMDVAEYYKWLNYTSESADKVGDADLWNTYLDSLNLKSENARKKVSKNIYPNEHKNDKATYLALCESRGLSPRFVRFAGEDWYMKLVNETRLSADESSALKPKYDLEAAQRSFAKFVDKGGYEGGWYKEGVDVDAEAKIVADDVLAGKKANEVDYGRQDGFAPESIIAGRKTNRTHNKNSLAKQDEAFDESKSLQSIRYNDGLPIRDDVWEKANTELPIRNDIAPTVSNTEKVAPMTEEKSANLSEQKDIAPPVKDSKTTEPKPMSKQMARILTEEPEVKQKSNTWSKFKTSFIDKASPFETLSLKTGNREVDAKFNSIRYADSKAQNLIGNGANGVKALNDVRAEVEQNGHTMALYEYLYHKHNIDRMTLENRFEGMQNKPVFGNDVTADVSERIVKRYDALNPKLKEYANDIYAYNKHLRNVLVEGGVISQETAALWEKMYPHYVPTRRVDSTGLNINVPLDSGKTGINAPIKRAKGGNTDILPLFDTMAQRTLQTYKAVAKNRFGVELKNTLGTTIENNETSLDELIGSIEAQEDLLQKGKDGKNPTFTVFENGEKVTFEITEEMYDAMKPTSEGLAKTLKVPNVISGAMRGVLTEYNPTFLITNAIKDAQDVLINSQHPVKTYKRFAKAVDELANKGDWFKEYMENGGADNTYFDKQTNTFNKEKSEISRIVGFPFEKISEANNFIERIPRLAEYIASRESGRSIDVAMLDAARVTTNFAAGGDVTKFLNRNGATFLNASVQGAVQQVRNVREAKAKGLEGWVHLATKVAVAGLPALLLNGLMWDDDEDYEELSDYVKENYYVVAKYGDGNFVRIPKGRTMAVIQNAFEQVWDAATGDDEVDLKRFLELAVSNLAPNNPIDNNILAPIMQVKENRTWYGDDLVPSRLQDLPAAEQYDESTDAISKWLGEKLNVSPYKINYLLNQYSGAVGDVILPMLTPEVESNGSFITAPLRDKFTTDGVLNNQNPTDFYDVRDKLTVNANSKNATDEDMVKNKYFSAISSEVGELYKEKREIQNSDLSDELKYKQVREIQKQINEITKNALETYEDVTVKGKYATIGDKHYRMNDDGEWQKITDEQLEKQNEVISILGITPSQYWGNKAEYDMKAFYPEKYAVLQQEGISVKDYKENYEKSAFIYTDEYSWAADNPEKYTMSKAVTGDVAEYKKYTNDLYNIRADKDSNGKSISGTAKAKKIAYINNLDIDYGAKCILIKSCYSSEKRYNDDIVEYLNGRDDISRSEMITILNELGATVDDEGYVHW